MKLLFTRSQFTNPRPAEFRLNVRGQVTHEENDAIVRYGYGDIVLYTSHDLGEFGEGFKALILRLFYYLFIVRRLAVHELGKGKTFKSSDVMELVDIEERVTDSARKLKRMIDIACGYNGEEVLTL